MVIARIYVGGVSAQATDIKKIPKGIAGATIEVTYSRAWENLKKTAVFTGVVTKDVLSAGSTVEIPAECVAKSGHRLRVGFYGVADETKVIPTLWADLGVIQDAADPSGDTSTDPSLPVWEQMQRNMESSAKAAVEEGLSQAKQSGEFDGPQGEKGNDGYTPVRGIDYWTPKDKESIVNETINSKEIQEVIESVETVTDMAEKAEAIARGKATGYVFNTFEDMQLWLASEANTKLLNLGDNLYIRAINVPDYWWDGNAAQQLETQKVDLTGYMKAADYPTEKWTFTLADGTTVEKDVVIG